MVFVYLNGRLGNYLFQVAAGLSLSSEVSLIAPSEKIYKEVLKYPEIFGKFTLLRNMPQNVVLYEEQDFYYKEIPYRGGDLILKGDFQSFKYIRINPKVLFNTQPLSVISYINNLKINPKEYVGIHVRRGDYLKLPHRHPFCGLNYYLKAIKVFPKGTKFLVCSDDMNWCRKKFKGNEYLFIDSKNEMIDFYLLAMCNSNIISNSTFSWWASFVNSENKRILAPSRWFGLQLKSISTRDLYLPKTEIIKVDYNWGLYCKALFFYYKDKISRLIHNYK